LKMKHLLLLFISIITMVLSETAPADEATTAAAPADEATTAAAPAAAAAPEAAPAADHGAAPTDAHGAATTDAHGGTPAPNFDTPTEIPSARGLGLGNYDFVYNGRDWANLVEKEGETNWCKHDTKNQSPINLMQPLGSYGWAYGFAIPKNRDNFVKSYTNISKDLKIKWKRVALKVALAPEEQATNTFTS
jgi:methionine-rich copper-binding protein CopC